MDTEVRTCLSERRDVRGGDEGSNGKLRWTVRLRGVLSQFSSSNGCVTEFCQQEVKRIIKTRFFTLGGQCDFSEVCSTNEEEEEDNERKEDARRNKGERDLWKDRDRPRRTHRRAEREGEREGERERETGLLYSRITILSRSPVLHYVIAYART